MAGVRIEASRVIERPVAVVFDFAARDHVRNHPRWDPDIELEQTSDDPIGVGTVIRRRNRRSGTPVEGTMEVVEFEHNRAIGTVIREGGTEVRGRATFEAVAPDRTTLTIGAEFPEMDEATRSFIAGRMQRSAQTIKDLIEAET